MSKVDFTAVIAVLEAIESGNHEGAVESWLTEEVSGVDALTADEALIGIEAAKRLGLSAHLVAAKGSSNKQIRKAASKAIHTLRASGHTVSEDTPDGRGWNIGAESRDMPTPVALVGIAQGDGYFSLVLVAYG